MTTTVFTNTVTLTDADWFNDVNRLHYDIFADAATAEDALAALQKKGADIVCAATINLDTATGDFVHITGSTGPVTAVTLASGDCVTTVFDSTPTLTYNATTLILPSSANIVAAAGDIATWRGDGSGNARCVAYTRRDGTAVVATASGSKVNEFRLTLTTVVPVTTADVTAATTIYCTPYKGNSIALFDGTNWNTRTSAEFSLALGTLTSGLPYDVFCYDNAGTPTLEFLAWTNGTTRATALALQNGVLSKTGALTRRYMGTFYTTSTTQTEDSKANRYLWNYYNRTLRQGLNTYTADRTTTSTSYTELNTEIRCNFILGYSEDSIFAAVNGSVTNTVAGNASGTGISFDSTTVVEPGLQVNGDHFAGLERNHLAISGLKFGIAVGYHYSTLLGKATSGTSTWDSADAGATAKVYLQIGIQG